MRCPDCERVTDQFHARNRILLAFPTGHSLAKFAREAERRGLAAAAGADPSILDLRIDRDALPAFADAASAVLSPEEMKETRALALDADAAPGPRDWLGVRPLAELAALVRGAWLVRLIERDRLLPAYQPILDRDGAVYGHESLIRGIGEDGGLIGGGTLMRVAEDAGLLFAVDQIARRHAIEGAARARLPGRLFVNFNPTSIYDPEACLGTTFAAVRELGIDPADVYFEVTESTEVRSRHHLMGILAFYRSAGFRIALDDIGSGFSGLNLLKEVRPDVIKVDMDLVRDVDRDPFRQSILTHLAGIARDTGSMILAEGIETAEEHAWLLDAGIDLFQGYALGRPEIPACLMATA